jgi:hypothetical protein
VLDPARLRARTGPLSEDPTDAAIDAARYDYFPTVKFDIGVQLS